MQVLDYDKTKIIEALTVIHNVCRANACSDCPFVKNEDCMIAYGTPDDWNIHSNEAQWRALN